MLERLVHLQIYQLQYHQYFFYILQDQRIEQVLLFSRTKHGADKIVHQLNAHDITAEAIHGNKSQNARQRALSNFKDQSTRVLVATDIAARGIDVDNLEFVVNFEIPNIAETYVHRIGRTGRAGKSGISMVIVSKSEVRKIKTFPNGYGDGRKRFSNGTFC